MSEPDWPFSPSPCAPDPSVLGVVAVTGGVVVVVVAGVQSTRASVTKAWDDLKSRYHDVVDFEENIDEIVKLEQAKRKESELVTALDDRKRVEWGMGLLRGFLGGTGLLAMAPLISQVDWSLKVVLLVETL